LCSLFLEAYSLASFCLGDAHEDPQVWLMMAAILQQEVISAVVKLLDNASRSLQSPILEILGEGIERSALFE
jgi:hypothetical protein